MIFISLLLIIKNRITKSILDLNHQETIVPHTCSSKFCSKCGSKAAKQRAAHVSVMAFESKHRHIVFTIPKELRPFLKDRALLEDFFTVSRNVLASLFNDCKYRKMKNKFKKNHICKKINHKSKYLYKDTRDNIIFALSLHCILLGIISNEILIFIF